MDSKRYLEGFIPYKEEIVEEYTKIGAWLNLTYGDLLDRAASQYPENRAVVDDRRRLTYKELKEKVDRFAIALIELGIKPHDRVIIQLPNRYEFVVAFYAFQKIGVVPVLAIPRHGYQEMSIFVRLTEAVGWILPVRDGKLDFTPLINEVRSEYEGLKYVIMPEDDEPLPPKAVSMDKLIENVKLRNYDPHYLDQFRPDPNDVAVLIPTGGTTGLPKMVPRTHNNLIITNKYISKGLEASDSLLQATPVGHAMSMQGAVNCAVYKGAALVLQGIPRPTEIMGTIQKEKVTRVFLVPTQLEGVINHPDLHKYDLSSLKVVGTTGAALPREIAQKAVDYFEKINCKFSGNALGASEGLLAQGDPDDPLEEQLKTVGRNVTPGSHYKAIDENENELPVNTEGELVARGPEVFTGYYKATEEENREVFTHDGYYRTGDLAKIDERGYIAITGRKKDVIMRGGETLVPSEMEDLIRKHPVVEGVAVVGMPDPKMGERACAYVVPKAGKGLSFDEMIEFLKGEGASVLLLPERLEIIDSLPLTGVGKVDKKTLRKDIESKLEQEAKSEK
jgi:2,3-dihydroxybenzoate-AMP ligase/mycobactin salicyl-AMP ligase